MKDIILKLEKLIKECSVALAGNQEAEISIGADIKMGPERGQQQSSFQTNNQCFGCGFFCPDLEIPAPDA